MAMMAPAMIRLDLWVVLGVGARKKKKKKKENRLTCVVKLVALGRRHYWEQGLSP